MVDSFDDMNLSESLLRGIYAYGFEKPSAIQQRAILPCIKGMAVSICPLPPCASVLSPLPPACWAERHRSMVGPLISSRGRENSAFIHPSAVPQAVAVRLVHAGGTRLSYLMPGWRLGQ